MNRIISGRMNPLPVERRLIAEELGCSESDIFDDEKLVDRLNNITGVGGD